MALPSEKCPIPTVFSDQALHLLAQRETWLFPEDAEFPAALMRGSHFLSHTMYQPGQKVVQVLFFLLPATSKLWFLP